MSATPNASSADVDAGVRVIVKPSQSSYFAGESFSVTITFTNTRSLETVRPQSHAHKRGAHSISSAPLARPPTSPGTPRSAAPELPSRQAGNGDTLSRRGLIGKARLKQDGDEIPGILEQSRKGLLARSLSVDINPREVGSRLSGSSRQPLSESPLSAHISSPLARSPSQVIPANHPHARKQSVLDGQLQLHEMQQSISPSPYPPSASTSAFSLSLDPIAESSTHPPFPPTTIAEDSSASKTTASEKHSYPPRPTRRPSHISLGHGPPPPVSSLVPPRTAFSSTFPQPNTELILYSYAQLTGSLSIIPLPGTTATSEQASTLNGLRATLLKRSVIGGGSMDITSSLHPQQSQFTNAGRRRVHSRSSSFSSSILSLLSPSPSAPTMSSQAWTPTHRARTQSVFSGIVSPSPSAGTLGGETVMEEVDPDVPLPTFEVQPTMLAVDLALGPGESRSFTYTIPLPENLPPTFKGRSLKFSYELAVGTCRAGSSSLPGFVAATGANSVSQVMKVPIRVYNNVVVGRQQRPYDLLWPVARRKNPGSDSGAKVTEGLGGGAKPGILKPLLSPSLVASGTLGDLQEYAQRLLASYPDVNAQSVPMKVPEESISLRRSDIEREEEGSLTGCREAVEILTRNPKKASYDVNKDGVKVAVLTFTKSAYRLGETVLGVVELNERKSRARVLKLSAMLEAQETLPSSITTTTNSRHMRRVHAEHHSSFVLSTLRTTFALDIPSDASPAFQVQIGNSPPAAQPHGGLEWKVRLCLLVAIASESSMIGSTGARFRHVGRDGPRGEWGTSWKAPGSLGPLEKLDPRARQESGGVGSPGGVRGWASYFASSLLGATEREYHDGDEDPGEEEDVYDGLDFGGGEEGWRGVKVETVECEVPIKVWPGNTAFKAMEVVFDV